VKSPIVLRGVYNLCGKGHFWCMMSEFFHMRPTSFRLASHWRLDFLTDWQFGNDVACCQITLACLVSFLNTIAISENWVLQNLGCASDLGYTSIGTYCAPCKLAWWRLEMIFSFYKCPMWVEMEPKVLIDHTYSFDRSCFTVLIWWECAYVGQWCGSVPVCWQRSSTVLLHQSPPSSSAANRWA